MVSSFWQAERVSRVHTESTWVWPRVNRPEPWARGSTPTSALRGRISFFWRPSTRWPSSSQALTIFFWNL